MELASQAPVCTSFYDDPAMQKKFPYPPTFGRGWAARIDTLRVTDVDLGEAQPVNSTATLSHGASSDGGAGRPWVLSTTSPRRSGRRQASQRSWPRP